MFSSEVISQVKPTAVHRALVASSLLAEAVRFELTNALRRCQFSRLVHSTALPRFQWWAAFYQTRYVWLIDGVILTSKFFLQLAHEVFRLIIHERMLYGQIVLSRYISFLLYSWFLFSSKET